MADLHPSEHARFVEHCADVAASAIDRVLTAPPLERGLSDEEHARMRQELAAFLRGHPLIKDALHGDALKRSLTDLTGGNIRSLQALWWDHEERYEKRKPLLGWEGCDGNTTLAEVIDLCEMTGDRIMAVYDAEGRVVVDRTDRVRQEVHEGPGLY